MTDKLTSSYGQQNVSVSFVEDRPDQLTGKGKRTNLKRAATSLVANVRNDITIPHFTTVLQPNDGTLIKRGGGRGLAIYDEIECDPYAFAVLQKRKKTLVAREWEVVPGGEDQVDLDAADLVETVLGDLPFDRICEDLLDATLKGFAISEIIWKRDNNRIVPDQIVTHEQRRFVFDLDWKPRLLTLANLSDGEELPDRKFMVHRVGVKGNNPYGLGLGTRLFWPVLFKRDGVAHWLTFLDKFSSPTVMGTAPYGLTDAMERKLLDTLASIRNNAAMTVPPGTEVKLLEATRTSASSHEDWCKFWNVEISVGTLGETLTTDVQDKGSRAAGEVHADILQMLVDADSDLLSATLRRTLINWLVEYNFPGAKLPNVWRARPANEQAEAEAEQAKAKSSKDRDEALNQIVTTAAKFTDDDDAKEYIQLMTPELLDADMIDRLVANRHTLARTATDVALDQPQVFIDPLTGGPTVEPKKKVPRRYDVNGNLITPNFADGDTDHDADMQSRLADQTDAFSADWDRQRLNDIREALERSDSLNMARREVLSTASTWTVAPFVKTIELALTASAFAGRDAVLGEMIGTAGFAVASAFDKPFQEQIDFFTQKEVRPSATWLDITKGDHDRAFIIAGAKDRAMLADFQSAIAKAMKDGTTLQAFRKDFDGIVAKHGWTYNGVRGWRTRTIFETNIRTSYMAGRLKQMRDPAVLKARPYWQYRHGQTRKPKIPRDEHLAWDGLILPADDPFWDQHFPPNGFGCSCGVRTLSQRDLERLGKTEPDQSPPTLMEPRLDPQTGKLVEHPAGIDHGFDYQPGDLWERGLVPSQLDRLSAKSAFSVDDAGPIEDLVANGKAFKAVTLKEGRKPEFYVDAFLKVFGAKRGAAVLFTDEAGGTLPISDELFKERSGEWKATKRGREVHAAQVAETIKDPDEIWIGVATVAIPADQGGGTEMVIDRKYIRSDPVTGLIAIFELLKGQWHSRTAFRPTKKRSTRTDVNAINKRRSGVLIYKREADTDRSNDE